MPSAKNVTVDEDTEAVAHGIIKHCDIYSGIGVRRRNWYMMRKHGAWRGKGKADHVNDGKLDWHELRMCINRFKKAKILRIRRKTWYKIQAIRDIFNEYAGKDRLLSPAELS